MAPYTVGIWARLKRHHWGDFFRAADPGPDLGKMALKLIMLPYKCLHRRVPRELQFCVKVYCVALDVAFRENKNGTSGEFLRLVPSGDPGGTKFEPDSR